MTDPISDMLIRIKNAQMAKKPDTAFPYSKIKFDIAKILERDGYITDTQKKGRKNQRLIEIKLSYNAEGKSKISEIKRISKLSRRVYRGWREIFPVKRGIGMAVYSTPKGLLTGKEARSQKVGGELLFEIY